MIPVIVVLQCVRAVEKITNGPIASGQRASPTTHIEDTWRYLHWPFELCTAARGYHKCEWQVFNADRAGCLKCSSIHRCSPETCQMVQTEEAMVCEVTGLCVVTKNFVQQQYSECIAYQGEATTSESARIEISHVRHIVQYILSSEKASQCRLRLTQRLNNLLFHSIQLHSTAPISATTSNTPSVQSNVIEVIEAAIDSVRHRIDMPMSLSPADMSRVVHACTQEICSLISICYYKLHLHIRPSDMRDVVVGLLFLMRTGIYIHGVCVLPRLPRLLNLLPVENMLPKVFDLQCKVVTDIENRFKMHIRQQSRSKLLSVGFGDEVQMHCRRKSLRQKLPFLFPRPLDGDVP